MLACSKHACVPITCILTLRACRVSVCMCKCQCRSVSVCSATVVEVSVCKCQCRSVSVQRIFRKNPSQCFREKGNSKAHQKNRINPRPLVRWFVLLSWPFSPRLLVVSSLSLTWQPFIYSAQDLRSRVFWICIGLLDPLVRPLVLCCLIRSPSPLGWFSGCLVFS